MSLTVRQKWNPKQRQANRALNGKEFSVIGFGGAKKGGKSFWGRIAILRRALKYPGTKHLITRRSYNEVNKNHQGEIKRLCRKWGVRFRWDNQANAFFFPEYTYEGEPSALYLGYCETISDAERYQGIEWLTIWHEECTQVPWEVLQYINNELVISEQAAKQNAMAKIIYTCNPVGISKRAVKRNVRDPGMKKKDGILWIQANWHDNKPFKDTNPDFARNIERANKQSPWLAKALLDGDWNADPDRYFPFDDDEASITTHIRSLKVPYHAKWYCGLDAGSNPSAFAAIYIAKWKDKYASFNPHTESWERREHWHVVDEVILWDTDPDKQAEECKGKERELAYDPDCMLHNVVRICDPAADTENPKESQEATRTVLNIWGKYGLGAMPALRRGKLTGLNILRSLMRKGIFSIDPRAVKLITEIADAVHEKKPSGEIGSLTDPRQEDDACFVAGTLITTQRGAVPIEEVRKGDYALTRAGYRKVVKAGLTASVAAIYDVEFSDGNVLSGTRNHPIWIDGKSFTRIDALRYNDIVLSEQSLPAEVREWNPLLLRSALFIMLWKKLFSIVPLTGATRKRSMDGQEITSTQAEARRKKPFIGKSGSFITEPFQRVATFITGMGTSKITRLRTLNASPQKSIIFDTTVWSVSSKSENTWTKFVTWLRSGMGLRKGAHGIPNTEKRHGEIGNRRTIRAIFAESLSSPENQEERGSVPIIASRHGEESKRKTKRRAPALSAVSSSPSIDTEKQSAAPVHVVRVTRSGRGPVFNLTVEGMPEFFANGILVHNCDALRYPTTEIYEVEYMDAPGSAFEDLYEEMNV